MFENFSQHWSNNLRETLCYDKARNIRMTQSFAPPHFGTTFFTFYLKGIIFYSCFLVLSQRHYALLKPCKSTQCVPWTYQATA